MGTIQLAIILSLPTALGFLAGLTRWSTRALLISSGIIIIAYCILVIAAGAWAATCWDCSVSGNEWERGFVYFMAMLIIGGYTTVILALIWAGVGLGILLRRRRGTKLAT